MSSRLTIAFSAVSKAVGILHLHGLSDRDARIVTVAGISQGMMTIVLPWESMIDMGIISSDLTEKWKDRITGWRWIWVA